MSKQTKLLLIGFAAITFSIFIFILSLNFYNRYQFKKQFKNVFPDQPKISDIANPKGTKAINLKGIYYPYQENNNLYYFTENYSINTYNLATQQSSTYLLNTNIATGSIFNVKWLSNSKLLIFFIDQTLYQELTQLDGEDLPPISNNEIKKYYFDLATKQSKELDINIIDAVINTNHDRIYTLEMDEAGMVNIYEINPNGWAKNLVKNIGGGEIIALNTQTTLINNAIYYIKAGTGYSLYRFDIKNKNEEKIYDDLEEARISPNGKYAFINISKNSNINSFVYNLQTNQIDFNFPLPVLISRCMWDKQGDNLYYLAGENLKMDDESKYLNRRPSYVFFKYSTENKKNEQLNNHLYSDPIDPQSLMLDEENKKLYFIDIYMLEYALYYLDLKL